MMNTKTILTLLPLLVPVISIETPVNKTVYMDDEDCITYGHSLMMLLEGEQFAVKSHRDLGEHAKNRKACQLRFTTLDFRSPPVWRNIIVEFEHFQAKDSGLHLDLYDFVTSTTPRLQPPRFRLKDGSEKPERYTVSGNFFTISMTFDNGKLFTGEYSFSLKVSSVAEDGDARWDGLIRMTIVMVTLLLLIPLSALSIWTWLQYRRREGGRQSRAFLVRMGQSAPMEPATISEPLLYDGKQAVPETDKMEPAGPRHTGAAVGKEQVTSTEYSEAIQAPTAVPRTSIELATEARQNDGVYSERQDQPQVYSGAADPVTLDGIVSEI